MTGLQGRVKGRSLQVRLFDRLTKDPATGCWVFPARKGQGGYGTIFADGRTQKVHRVVYELLIGPIPPGRQLHHKCENCACCNPDHLQPTTPAEHNTHLSPNNPAFKHARLTHCKNGHPLTGDNVRPRRKKIGVKWRECVTCCREASRRWYARGDNAANLQRQRREKAAQSG